MYVYRDICYTHMVYVYISYDMNYFMNEYMWGHAAVWSQNTFLPWPHM